MESDKLTLKSQTTHALIIPALNPDEKLADLVKVVQQQIAQIEIIIIDDGSSPSFQPLFEGLKEEEYCIVVHHPKNLGKGAAIKTGMRYVMNHFPRTVGIITADCDGQHSPTDILRIAVATQEHPNSLILGVRDFSSKNVPFKSRYGNQITSGIFKLVTGKTCSDTQTGLRGIPARYYETAIGAAGECYEYEMNLLLRFAGWHIPFVELPIETIYHNENKGSHFRPIHDSGKVYKVIFAYWTSSLLGVGKSLSSLRFLVSSFLSFAIDMGIFAILKPFFLQSMVPPIFFATIIARLVSGLFNFMVNRKWVFRSKGNTMQQALAYLLLFISQMLLSGALVSVLSLAPIPLVVVKLVVDSILFLASYQIQNYFVFKKTKK